jgi:serine/threonine-protein kinase
VEAAQICLLNPAKKAAYDAELRGRLTGTAATPGVPLGEEASQPLWDYEILEQLADSRTGPLFKVRHRLMGRLAAVKLLSDEAIHSPQARERFYRKVRILARLSHPNLVAAHDAGERDGKPYLVMEYVDGRDLGSWLKQCGPFSVEYAAGCLAQAAAGLAYVHALGVIHRNVKPGNLMIDGQGIIKVVGLGLSRLESALAQEAGEPELTVRGRAVGTQDYMAPEQARDASSVDTRADIYSLGCTLHALLIGRAPYEDPSPMKVTKAHRTARIPSLCSLRPEVPGALDALFQRMMAKRPQDRLQTMEEVIARLQRMSQAY